MAKKKQRSEGFDEFLAEYNAAEIPSNDKHINSSKFSLKQQLDRFSKFFHSKAESETMLKEARVL